MFKAPGFIPMLSSHVHDLILLDGDQYRNGLGDGIITKRMHANLAKTASKVDTQDTLLFLNAL
jgi:hypothetical protein